MKVSFPFSMTVINRFLSQVYLKEGSHHNVTEDILSEGIEVSSQGKNVGRNTHRSFIMVTVVVKGSQDKSHDRLRLGLKVGCQWQYCLSVS